jgi:hypothetical protein
MDSTVTIMSKTKWAKEIDNYNHVYTYYSTLTNKNSYPIPHDSDLINNLYAGYTIFTIIE